MYWEGTPPGCWGRRAGGLVGVFGGGEVMGGRILERLKRDVGC